jgi:hypothetical protein
VVDDGALVVGAKQDERAIDPQQLIGAEAFDFALLVDHTPELVFFRSYLRHGRVA